MVIPRAVEALKERFERDDVCRETLMKELLNMPSVRSNDLKALRSLTDHITAHTRALNSLGVSSDSFSSLLLPIVKEKLPESWRVEWARRDPVGIFRLSCIPPTRDPRAGIGERDGDFRHLLKGPTSCNSSVGDAECTAHASRPNWPQFNAELVSNLQQRTSPHLSVRVIRSNGHRGSVGSCAGSQILLPMSRRGTPCPKLQGWTLSRMRPKPPRASAQPVQFEFTAGRCCSDGTTGCSAQACTGSHQCVQSWTTADCGY